jgi:hypothetical protein
MKIVREHINEGFKPLPYKFPFREAESNTYIRYESADLPIYYIYWKTGSISFLTKGGMGGITIASNVENEDDAKNKIFDHYKSLEANKDIY